MAAHPSSAARVARADVATPGGGGGFQLFAKPKTDRTKGKQPAAAAAATTVAAAAAGVSAQKGKAAHGDVAAAVAAESRALGSTKNAGERSRSKASHTASAAAAADDDDSEEGLERAGTQLLAPMGQAQASLVGFKSLGLNDWLVRSSPLQTRSQPVPTSLILSAAALGMRSSHLNGASHSFVSSPLKSHQRAELLIREAHPDEAC